MRKYYNLLKFSTFLIFALFVFASSPQQAHATSLNDIFSSPNSLFVKIQERIEYFFAFRIEQKVTVLEKQAERRLRQAENLVKTKDVDQALPLIKSYQTLKEKQGDLIKDAPLTALANAKEQTIRQQARIEEIKKNIPDEVDNIIEDSQREVMKTMVDNIKTEEDESKVTEFAEEVKNVLDPGSHIFAPGTNEVAPGTLEVAPGTKDIAP